VEISARQKLTAAKIPWWRQTEFKVKKNKNKNKKLRKGPINPSTASITQ